MWWTLRAELIAAFRSFPGGMPELVTSRLDYAKLVDLATQHQEVTVFTELRT